MLRYIYKQSDLFFVFVMFISAFSGSARFAAGYSFDPRSARRFFQLKLIEATVKYRRIPRLTARALLNPSILTQLL